MGGLLGSIAKIIGAAKKRKAVDRASSVLMDGADRGMAAITGNQTLATDAITGARDAGISGLQGAQQQAILDLIAGRDSGVGALQGQSQSITDGLAGTLGNFQPFIEAGQKATGASSDLLGLGSPEAQAAAIEALKASPLFKSLYSTGADTVLQNASATGGLRGGNVQRSLADFGESTLASTIENQLKSLGGLSAQGIGAAGGAATATANADTQRSGLAQSIADLFSGTGTNLANLGTGTAQATANLGTGAATQIAQLLQRSGINMAELFGAKGNAQASGILGKAGASQEMLSGTVQAIQDLVGAFAGVPGGGGGGGTAQAAQAISKFI